MDPQKWSLFLKTVKTFPPKSDPSLTVTPGPLPSLPSQLTVTASGAAAEKFPSYLGVYNKTERWWEGMPVYINTQGGLLYHNFNWMIGPELGSYVMQGSWSHQSPVCEKSWTYVTDNGIDEKPAAVQIVSDAGKLVGESLANSYLDLQLFCEVGDFWRKTKII